MSASALLLPLLLVSPSLEPVAVPPRLLVQPGHVELHGSLDRCQVLATREHHGQTDRTHAAVWRSADPTVAVVEAGVVRPRGDGTTLVEVIEGDLRAGVVVTVRGMRTPPAVSFRREVVPALSTAGCNQGACHGGPQGKGGFRLSLRGCDPDADFVAITRDSRGRRIDTHRPLDSLLLKKGTARIAHEGGRLLIPGTPPADVVAAWLARGAPADPPAATPALRHLEVAPAERLLAEKEQQLAVRAVYTDGRTRDVGALTVYTSSDPETATVDAAGRVRFLKAGEVAVLCRHQRTMQVARLTHVEPRPGFVWKAPEPVNYIDRHVLARLERLQLPPAEVCPDHVFLRRACLDLCALQPTPEMVRAFAADTRVDKRARLVESLLQRGDHADFWAQHWLVELGSSRGKLQLRGALAYRDWLRRHVADNTPFDAVVRELLTAQGHAYEAGAVNFFRARTPTDLAEITGQVFLGTRFGCARCHDHPYERWTRDDFTGLAAFFAGVKVRRDPMATKKPAPDIVEVVALGEATVPRFPGGDMPDIPPEEDRRAVLARWLTAKDNPLFAKAVVNRVWARLFGRGLVEPVDDFRLSNPPSNEALLEALAKDFTDHDFDVKHLLRTILASRTYQLSSTPHELSKDDTRHHARNYPRHLSPEQMLDALSAATEMPEDYDGMPAGTRAIQLPDPADQHVWLRTFSRPAREHACESPTTREPNLASALHLINSDGVQKKIQHPRNRIGRLLEAKAGDREIAEELFLATLGRLPTDKEWDQVVTHVGKGAARRAGWDDILWALLNTREFLYRN